MNVVDCHSHTAQYSTDGIQTLDELLFDATRQGLAGICLTDHYDKDICYEAGIEHIFDLATYFDHLAPVKASQPPDQAQLFIGIELGWMPHLTPLYNQIMADWNFDNVILSLHVMDDDKDIYVDRSIYDDGVLACYKRSLLQTVDMMKACPDFTILGHFDYVSRYVPGGPVRMEYGQMPEAFDAVFRHLIEHGKSLEFNTRTTLRFQQSGIRGADSWPDPAIFKRYLELGGQLISLSSDSHQLGQAATLFGDAIAYLQALGVQELTHFVNQKPVKTRIS